MIEDGVRDLSFNYVEREVDPRPGAFQRRLVPQKEGSMTTRSLGLLYVFRSPLIVAATLLLTFAATPTSGSQPKNGTRTGRANLGE